MSQNKRIVLQFGVFLAAWFVLYFSTLVSMVEVWGSSETYKHCFFIVPVVLYLFYERKSEFVHTQLQPNYWVLLALFAVQVINMFSELLGINLFTHASAYLSLVLIVWLCFGNQFVYRFAFPLFFLAFTIPFGDELVPVLQDITAYLTVEMLQLVGIPIYREGLYLYVPNGTFLVAEACAGIRFLIASFALGTLFAYLNYKTRWKIVAFVFASLIVPIIANGIRAFGIVVIGYLTDMEHATGADHLVYGWFFFAFVLLLLFGIGQIGRENTQSEKIEGAPTGTVKVMPIQNLIMSLLVVATVGTYTTFYINSIPPVPSSNLTNTLNANEAFTPQELSWQPDMTNPHEEWSGVYKTNNNQTPIYVAKYYFDNDEHEMVSGLSRYYNIDNFTRKTIDREMTSKGQVNLIELVDIRGNNVALVYWFEVDGKRTASSIPTKVNQTISKLAGNHGAGVFIAVQVNSELPSREAKIKAMEAAIEGFQY
ncbi:exosortase A [Brumicola nitratireducens]|uniref:Eight transmembrane protein EpsH n=1 Tax=Glaciecola nitratireducens (strain JCM 12485 / KCTC 12276 / FR1064) TaxID=1085623 RepID=G4QI46_GLANF|nr:exosortase A [Glaciecola nitratireducens]AEP30660.1 eight transmembrane protein EpsH [Glaciecola nitratireducens FR1064]